MEGQIPCFFTACRFLSRGRRGGPSPEPVFSLHVAGLGSGSILGKANILQKLVSERTDFKTSGRLNGALVVGSSEL